MSHHPITAPEVWVRTAAEVLDAPSDQFGPTVIGALRQIVPSDRGLILVYRRSSHPWMLYSEKLDEYSSELRGRDYLQRGYLLDPYYRSFLKGLSEGVYTLRDLGDDALDPGDPRGWTTSDHVTYLAPVSGDSCVVLLLFRDQPGWYRPEDLEACRALQRAVCPALRDHWATHRTSGDSLQRQVQRALDRFGSDVLTPRERAVIRLLLRGCSSKATGLELGIAPSTAAIHRKRAYAKLDVSSQAELFHLFISSLSSKDAVD